MSIELPNHYQDPKYGWNNECDVQRFKLDLEDADYVAALNPTEAMQRVRCLFHNAYAFGIEQDLALQIVFELNCEHLTGAQLADIADEIYRVAYKIAVPARFSEMNRITDADVLASMPKIASDPDLWMHLGDPTPSEYAVTDADDEMTCALKRISRDYCAVVDGGQFNVMYMEESDDMPGRRFWKTMSRLAFESFFANKKLERDMEGLPKNAPKTIQLGQAWITWPFRPSARGVTFDTTTTKRIVKNRLNMWTGFGLKPKPGDWSKLESMIRNDLCGGNQAHADYVLNWLAWKIQNPGLPCSTSLVFRGAQGVGKTTLGELMIDVFGSHGLPVSRRNQFAGQFSGHLATAVFVFADEAIWGGNKEDEGTLKKLITDKHVTYRAMYKEEAQGINRVGLMMATNEKWAVPAAFEDRRFVVLEVSDAHQVKKQGISDDQKAARVEYWNQLRTELDGGGREAFLAAMLVRPLGEWKPYHDAPQTAALGAQIEEGLRGVQRWYYEALTEGKLPGGDDLPVWADSEVMVPTSAILTECRAWMHSHGERATVTLPGLYKELKTFGWRRGARSKAARRWRAPTYPDAMAAMEKRLGRKID